MLPALHYALVAHEMCPEHGQLEHAGNRVETHTHHDGGPAYTTGSDDDHHDHCGSIPVSPPRAPLAGDATRVFEVARAMREDLVVPSTAVLTADVVAFAPKQSPPGVVVRS